MKNLYSENNFIQPRQIENKSNILILFLFTIIGYWSIIYFHNYPISIIYILQYFFIFYILYNLKIYRASFILLFYPFFKFLFYESYGLGFNAVGDFNGYAGLLTDFSSNYGMSFDTILFSSIANVNFYFLTIINVYLPMVIFDIDIMDSTKNFIFLYFNDLVFVILVAFIVNAFKGVIKDKYILYFVIFLLFSPTVLSFTWQPDRHIFSLFALFIFVRGYIEWKNYNKLINYYMVISIVLIYLNKPILLLALLFIIIFNGLKIIKNKAIALSFFLISLFLIFYVFQDTLISYFSVQQAYLGSTIVSSVDSSSIFSWMLIIPAKYIYAVLSPFPWYKFTDFLIINTGGSYMVLAMMYLNSVFGLSVVFSLVKYNKIIKHNTFIYENFIWIGMVFSTTIILGHIGHSGYLSIYYFLFLPIFFIIGAKNTLTILVLSFSSIVILNSLLFIIGF